MTTGGANGEPGWAVSACRVFRVARASAEADDGRTTAGPVGEVAPGWVSRRSTLKVLVAALGLSAGGVLKQLRTTVAQTVYNSCAYQRVANSGDCDGSNPERRQC
jgi:hypothetical protein